MPYTLNVFTGQFDYYASLAIGSTVLNGTTGSVLFVGSSGEIAQDNTNFFYDDTNNILKLSKLHIGATSATLYPFNLDASPTLSGTSYLTANFIATYTPSANFSESVTGFFAQTTLPLGGYDATGTIAGGFGSVRVTGSGNVNIAAGFRGVVTNINTAVITDGQCFRASVAANISTGSITELSSFYSPDQTAGTSNIGFNGNISSGSNKWNLYMGGTAQNYLAGKLGVGVTAPTYKLEIDGDSAAPGTLLVQAGGTAASTGNTFRVYRNRSSSNTNSPVVDIINDAATDDQVLFRLQQDAPADIVNIFDGANEVFTILDGGNVGIGTTSPSFLLDVQGPAAAIASITGYADTASGGSFLGRKARGTQSSPTKVLADDKLSAWGGRGYVQSSGFQSTSSGRFQIAAAEDYNSTSNLGSYMTFETTPIGSGTIREVMRIDSTGNVGIGSSTPVSMLTVGATNGISSKLVTVSDVTSPTSAAGASGISVVLQGGGGIYMKDNGNSVEGKFEAYGGAMGIGTMTTHALGLWADNGEKMTILAGGNVGIGNTNPSAVLHIKAGTTAASTAPIKLTSGSFNTTAEAGTMEYNNAFALTESDATRRYIVQAAASTKTTAGAPYTNDGYVTVRINGVDVKLMTTA